MKILSLNVGIKLDNTKQILEFLKKNSYDIICMQEVLKAYDDNVFERYKTYNYILNEFQDLYKSSRFTPLWGASEIIKNGKTHKNFNGFVEQGNFLMSKYKIINSYSEFYHFDYTEKGYDATNFRRDDHARAIQRCIIDINNKKLQVINVHGIWNEDKKGNERTYKQCQFIINKAVLLNIPTIIIGDFNLKQNTKDIQLFNNEYINLIDIYNIKSTRPSFDDGLDTGDMVCDYIFATKDIKINNFEVLNDDFSDHLPLVLDFEIE